MVKKKSLDLEPEEKEKEQLIEEDDEIIELEEVLEEPEELPVGENLDELLFSEDDDAESGEVDLESLDATLGIDEPEKEEAPLEEPVSPTQEDIDALFEEQSSVEELGELSEKEPETGEEKASPEVLEDVDVEKIISELEERIVQKIEEVVESKLPELVLKTVREELESIQREFEKNK